VRAETNDGSWLPPGFGAAAVLTFDVDGESSVLFDAPESRDRLSIMSHQAYGPRIGVPRILAILRRHDVRATFFVPGFIANRYPDVVRSIVDDGHEVGHHGYLHESVSSLTPEREEEVLLRGIDALLRVTGRRPAGWRGPMWEVNYTTPELLVRHGFEYDSSLMDDDSPYLLRVAEDPSAPTLVEIPVHWGLDDGEQYAWLPGIWEGGGIASPRKVLELWTLELQAIAAEGGCFVPTIHPCFSGRPSRAAAVDELVSIVCATPDLWVGTAADLAEHVRSAGDASRHHPPIPATDER
jgi:peptidoglycan/xylan/chitin deacetylase (PgdA/CDA1 family)